jgi:hypothetical protein
MATIFNTGSAALGKTAGPRILSVSGPEPDRGLPDLAAFGLKPHIVQTWKLFTDPQFIVRDVVGLYMSPPENALVLCVDEKSQIQAYPGDNSGVRDSG